MFLLVTPEDEDIIKLAKDSIQSMEDLRHMPLEMLRSAGDAKGEFVKTVATCGSDKGGEEVGRW